jgi:hypothetical protein
MLRGIAVPLPELERELVALHEAAHYVAARTFGREPYSVTTRAHDGDAGSSEGEIDLPREPDVETVMGYVVELFAGHAATVHRDRRFAKWSLLVAADDSTKAEWFLGLLHPGSRRRGRDRARALVARKWGAIEALAGALLEHVTLNDDEAELVLQQERHEITPEEFERQWAICQMWRSRSGSIG